MGQVWKLVSVSEAITQDKGAVRRYKESNFPNPLQALTYRTSKTRTDYRRERLKGWDNIWDGHYSVRSHIDQDPPKENL